MSWFSSHRNRNAAAAKGRAAAASLEPEVHRSLGLAALFEGIAQNAKLQVLDLGSAVGSNIDYLARFGCKVYIEDLYSALSARTAMRPGGDRLSAGFFADTLAFPADTRFDAILAWDLFNYLERKELAELAVYLARYCRPGALMLALMSIAKQIPQQPFRFRIVDHQQLAYERQSAGERPCPRYAPAELGDLVEGFRIDRSFLMRHGIQEYLFQRQAD